MTEMLEKLESSGLLVSRGSKADRLVAIDSLLHDRDLGEPHRTNLTGLSASSLHLSGHVGLLHHSSHAFFQRSDGCRPCHQPGQNLQGFHTRGWVSREHPKSWQCIILDRISHSSHFRIDSYVPAMPAPMMQTLEPGSKVLTSVSGSRNFRAGEDEEACFKAKNRASLLGSPSSCRWW